MRWTWVLALMFLGGITGQIPVVSSVSFAGNKITEDYILLREIQHPSDIPLDSTLAREDRDRLLNLGIFADVYWRAIPLEDRTVMLEYEVVESRRIIGGPMPVFEEKTGWSISAGLIWKNFRGRNETVMFGGSLGGRTTYGISYTNPWFTGDHVSLGMNLGKDIAAHPFLPYEIKISSFEFNMGRYFGYTKKLSLGFEIEEKVFERDSLSIPYRYFAPQGAFQYDTRDIYLEPTRGYYITQAFYSMLHWEGRRKPTIIWMQSLAGFQQLNQSARRLVLGLNLSTRFTLGQKEEFWIGYMGSTSTVRGWKLPGRELYSGGKQSYRFGYYDIVASVELRKTWIPRYATRFDFEFGLTTAWFVDMGLTAMDFSSLRDQIPLMGTGISIQMPYPYIGIIRLEYGWGFRQGKQKDTAIHFAVEQKF